MSDELTRDPAVALLWAIFGASEPNRDEKQRRFDAIKVGDYITTLHGPKPLKVTGRSDSRVYAGRCSFKAWEIRSVSVPGSGGAA